MFGLDFLGNGDEGRGGGYRKYAKAVNEGPEVTINKYKKAWQQQYNI